MTRKHDTTTAAAEFLHEAVRQLEDHEDDPRHPAPIALLTRGPLSISRELLEEPQRDTPNEVRAELLSFLRRLVAGRPVALDIGSVMLLPALINGRMVWSAEGGLRDLAKLQLVLSLSAAGLENVRVCPAPTPFRGGPPLAICGKLFVKTYRREYCGNRCQQRAYKRLLRARNKQEPKMRRRRITRGGSK
jgi:hypothetical protein